jgi:hypothetical protein
MSDSSAAANDASPETARPPGARARWLRRAIIIFVAVLLLGFVAPYVFSWGALHNVVLNRVFGDLKGSVQAGTVELGWFSPPRVTNFAMFAEDGEPLVKVASVTLDRPLWRIIFQPYELVHVQVEQPHAYLVVYGKGEGSNFTRSFPRRPTGKPSEAVAGEKQPGLWTRLAVDVEIDSAAFTWQLHGAAQAWSIEHIQFAAGIQPARMNAAGRPQFVIAPGTIIDHAELSSGMCDDVLKFAAPILARATVTAGQISVVSGGGTFPIGAPQAGEFSGVLALHSVDVSPGPFVQELTAALKASSVIHLARESTVKFHMADGRVHHEGLEFGVDDIRVRTSGSVQLSDQTLDMIAEVHFQIPESVAAKRPFLQALDDQVLRLPIRGTLQKPKVDAAVLGQAAVAILVDTIKSRRTDGTGATPETLDQLRQQGLLGQASPGLTTAESEMADDAAKLARELLERRRERLRERAESGEPGTENGAAVRSLNPGGSPPDTGSSAEGPPPARRPLGRALQRLLRDGESPPPDDAKTP